jgi:hypothetical protein
MSAATFRVTIDMFSGRPNPSWEIAGDEASQLVAKLRDLRAPRPELAAKAAPPGLGYRGIVVGRLSGDETVPDEVRAFNSVLSVKRKGAVAYHEDNARIQEFLFGLARAKGHAATIEKMSVKAAGR